ncbi:hypothetical protein C8R45DRAFT_943716 [Mycena sanguinolenta]|nr:hypothetical protein C8R45DRAFT_943716 [Mycena sanguinolenta]
MEVEDRVGFDQLQSLADDDSFHVGDLQPDINMVNMENVLDGSEQIDLSHRGGEFSSLEQDIEADSGNDDEERKAQKVEDWRTRCDCTNICSSAFEGQMPAMVSAYICLCAEPEMSARPRDEGLEEAVEEEVYEIQVVDMFETNDLVVKLDAQGNGVAPMLILEGLMPGAPWSPTVTIKIRVLEAYRVTHVQCPHLAIQSFVKSLCDIHGIAYRPYLCQQFSIAYDLYVEIRCRTDERVMRALGRDSSWRLKHACPACTYKLEGEDAMIFEMLTMMDGNDSLKRVLWLSERLDNRDAGDGYFISQEKVDRWAKSRLGETLPMQAADKMWGIFDETGIFLALCRHGFVLVIADMIKSGKLVKYPLAIVKELLDAFGMKLGAGYNIGCSFHGHAHNRLCQLRFLAINVEGMGLEDLEGCERFFSRSNGLAKSCRYASRFHRQQEITTYAKHFDSFETYANLSKSLCSNYRQALTILKTEAPLRAWMCQEGVEGVHQFHQWLAEEKTYLDGLKNAPKTNDETLEMEYVQRLVNLSASEYMKVFRAKYEVVAVEVRRARADDGEYTLGVSKAGLARRHAREKMEKELDCVHELEAALGIEERWSTTSPKWTATVNEVKKHKYQLTLDGLELLIVERIFELTKMIQPQTGYKMRKHIAKALQARSKAVKNAIERYNTAAAALEPPMPSVSWEQVVEYAFLADFDILRDTRAEVQSKPWSRPAYRDRAAEYRDSSHHDENHSLRKMEKKLRETEGKSEEQVKEDAGMGVHLTQLPGFTGTLRCGVSVECREAQRRLWELQAEFAGEIDEEEMEVDEEEVVGVSGGMEARASESDEEDEGHEAREEAVSGLLYQISMLAVNEGVHGAGDNE